MLRAEDQQHLESLGLPFELAADGGLVCVVISGWPLPPGYAPERTDLLLRLPAGFPDAAPDMYWCEPFIRVVATGSFPQAADQMETHLGRTWQRFSRHLSAGQWQPGRDNLASYLALIRHELASTAPATTP
jgi:hypothetical protein